MGNTNFFYLLGALLVLLLGTPLAHDLGMGDEPLARGVLVTLLLLIGAWSLKGGGHYFLAGMAIAVVGIVCNALAVNMELVIFRYCSILALLGFLLVAISFTLRQVVFGTEMNVNRLVGAICVFLLLGLIWSLAYALVELIAPGSFKGFSSGRGPGEDSSWQYFSFVTLTTLGYGDITPVSATARSLAFLQAVAGQFYVAVLVAGLVSAYISDRRGS